MVNLLINEMFKAKLHTVLYYQRDSWHIIYFDTLE